MNVKNEISLQDSERNMELIELSAFIRNNGKIENDIITLSTENNKVAKHLYVMIKKMFNVVANIDDKTGSFNRNRLFIITISHFILIFRIINFIFIFNITSSNFRIGMIIQIFISFNRIKIIYIRIIIFF